MKIAISLIFAALLSGCAASGPIYTQSVSADPDMAIVYLYRPDRFFQGGGSPDIFVNDEKSFKMKNGGYTYIKLPEGKHTISPRKNFNWALEGRDTEIEVRSGKIYYLKMVFSDADMNIIPAGNIAVGTVSGATRFIEVPTTLASTELLETRLNTK